MTTRSRVTLSYGSIRSLVTGYAPLISELYLELHDSRSSEIGTLTEQPRPPGAFCFVVDEEIPMFYEEKTYVPLGPTQLILAYSFIR
jgi:hypothetical protein